MAGKTIVIDMTAGFTNRASVNMSRAKKEVDRLGKSLMKTKEQVEKLTKDKWTMRLLLLDDASCKLAGIYCAVSKLEGRIFRFGVGILDYATKPMREMMQLGNQIIGEIAFGGIAAPPLNAAQSVPTETAGESGSVVLGFLSDMLGETITTGVDSLKSKAINGLLTKLGAAPATTATVGGIVLSAAGLISAGKDFAKGMDTTNKKEKQDSFWKSGTKAGLVATGAGVGAAIGSVIPGAGTAIGAAVGGGIGGLIALLEGDSMGQWLSDMADGTQQIRNASSGLNSAWGGFTASVNKDESVNTLLTEYEKLNKKLAEGNLPVEERKTTQEKINGLVKDLSDFYPTLISQYDIEQGKIGVNLDSIRSLSEVEKEQAQWKMQKEVYNTKKVFETKDIEGNLKESDERLAQSKVAVEKYYDPEMQAKYKAIREENDRLREKYDIAAAKGDSGNEELQKERDALTMRANNLAYTVDSSLGNYQNTDEFLVHFDEFLEKKMQSGYETIEKETVRNNELRQSYADLVNGSMELSAVNNGLEGNFFDAAKNYDNLDPDQKNAFKRTIEDVLALQRELKNLPEELKLDVTIVRRLFEDEPLSTPPIEKHANGGILNRPHLGLVAEAGPEAVIPLSDGKRRRGLSLWLEAGRRMGVAVKGDKEYPAVQSHLPATDPQYENAGGVTVNLGGLGGMTFTFEGTGGRDKDSIMQVIRKQMPEIADALCQTIAKQLSGVFGNLAMAQV